MPRIPIAIAVLLGAVLWAPGASVLAQVAATDFVPAATRFHHPDLVGVNSATITPDNPAALAWGEGFLAAIGTVQGTHRFPGTPVAREAGRFYGARLVGETFGLGVEYLAMDEVTPPNEIYDRIANAQLSLKLGWLALGVGSEQVTSEVNGNGYEFKRAGAGLSLRLWDVLYLGGGLYADQALDVLTPVAQKRDLTMAGIALRTEGSVRWYLALDGLDQQPFNFQPGTKTRALSVQMLAGDFLFGIAAGRVFLYGPGIPAPPDTLTQTVDIGWVPEAGWNLSARWHQFSATGGGLPSEEANTTQSLALTRRF